MKLANASASVRLPDSLGDDFMDALGTALRQRGLLDDFALHRARRAQFQSKERLDLVISRLGLATENALAEILSDILGIAQVLPLDYPERPLHADALQAPFLKTAAILPLSDDGTEIVLAVADPFNQQAITSLGYLLERTTLLRLAPKSDIERHIDRLMAPSRRAPRSKASRSRAAAKTAARRTSAASKTRQARHLSSSSCNR